jgi:hypothetical protein
MTSGRSQDDLGNVLNRPLHAYPGRLFRAVEFDAYLFGVRVVEFLEDLQCVLPGAAGRVHLAGGLLDVA